MKARVFSGVQPTGNLHIGNYLGAIKNFVRLQHDYECIFCVVDLHAITAYQKPDELRAKIVEIAGLFLAAGIDPNVSTLIVQSAVPAHAELAWMLTCVTPIGWLHRMTQFKAKLETMKVKLEAGKEDQLVSVGDGILQYPVLMAADILLYDAAIVPVGDDQAQHLELTRDIAERFNSMYGDTFVVPKTKLPAVGARVMGLDDPTKKMSKSAQGSGHSIALLDPPDVAKKKIMRAVTDAQPGVNFAAPGDGIANLLSIFQAFSEWPDDKMRAHFEGKRYGDFKKEVAEMVISHLEPFQARYREITGDAGHLDRLLAAGAERANAIANRTVRTVKERMGLYVGA
jgi:tryptophanyl-tRNA synthetase